MPAVFAFWAGVLLPTEICTNEIWDPNKTRTISLTGSSSAMWQLLLCCALCKACQALGPGGRGSRGGAGSAWGKAAVPGRETGYAQAANIGVCGWAVAMQ